jgi:hypothetical protein
MKGFDQRLEEKIHLYENGSRMSFRAESPWYYGRGDTLFLEGSQQWGEERDKTEKFGPRSPLGRLGSMRCTEPRAHVRPQLPTIAETFTTTCLSETAILGHK